MTTSLGTCHIVIVVWGNSYTEEFLQYSLPTQLSDGNLGACSHQTTPHIYYHIFAATDSASVIQESKIFSVLETKATTQIHIIDELVQQYNDKSLTKYDVMTICHQRCVGEAVRSGGGLIVLSPDTLVGDGTIRNLFNILESGKKVAVIGGFRTSKEKFLVEFPTISQRTADGAIAVSNRDLVGLSLKHIHPYSSSLYWDSATYHQNGCAFLYWPVSGEGLVQRGIHLHPIASRPDSERDLHYQENARGIDGVDYVERMCASLEDVYIIADSDIAYTVTLQPMLKQALPSCRSSILRLSRWVMDHACSYQRNFMTTPIFFHARDMTPEFETIKDKSERIVHQILTMVDAFETSPEVYHEIAEIIDVEGVKLLKQNQLLVREAAEAYNILGVEFYKGGRFQDAQRIWKLATNIYPSGIDAYDNLAWYATKNGDFSQAIHYEAMGLYLDPGNLKRWTSLGRLYEQVGDYKRADECMYQANKLSERSHV